jgi:RNA polymerase sigma factor (sigma-70 family)
MVKPEEIENIYNLYIDDLFIYAIYLGFDRETAMDVIHDLFLKLATDFNSLDSISNIKIYLFKSLKNKLYDLNKIKREFIDIKDIDASQETFFKININIEDLLIEKEEQEKIHRVISEMLNSLTSRQREIIYLRYIQEYDYPQISEILNISVHGCRKLVSKAIQSLRDKYSTDLIILLLYYLNC